MSRDRIVFAATVDVHIYAFHIPFMKLLKSMGYDVEVACRDTGISERIEKEGFVVHKIPFSRNPLSFSNLRAFFELLKLMKENKYIMLHAHTPVASFLGRIAGKMAKIPHIVYTAHGFHFHEYGSKLRNFLYYRLEKFAGKFTDILITINKDDYKIANKVKICPRGKIVYVSGVGVDTNKVKIKSVEENRLESSEVCFPRKDPIILTIGRLEREKNLDHFLYVLSMIKDSGKKVQGFIVGEGPLRSYFQKAVVCNHLSGYVTFTGYFANAFQLISKADVYVFTSSREGLPVSVMEAMAMEKPVVAYNIRGVRDLVVDGETGFLVPFGDIRALAEKISFLLDNPIIAEEMGKKGRSRIIGQFDLDTVLRQMKEVYEDALSTFQGKGDR